MLHCYRRLKLGNAKTIASIVRSISPNRYRSRHNRKFVRFSIAQFFIADIFLENVRYYNDEFCSI